MGNWDDIYKEYQQGGEAWATLSEGIDPRFISFIAKESFSKKKALDIGCGTGKYLLFLEQQGFQVTGIDASPTATEMTKQVVSKEAIIYCENMYTFDYPQDNYDLVLSISTLHHGYKEQVQATVQRIYKSLVQGGKVFITLPNIEASKSWKTFKDQTELAAGTYAPNTGPETGLPHSFYTEQEVRDLFSAFQNIRLELDSIGRWFIIGSK